MISASDGYNQSRNTTGSSDSNYSDLQVYAHDDDNKLLFTIPGSSYSYDALNFVSGYVGYGY